MVAFGFELQYYQCNYRLPCFVSDPMWKLCVLISAEIHVPALVHYPKIHPGILPWPRLGLPPPYHSPPGNDIYNEWKVESRGISTPLWSRQGKAAPLGVFLNSCILLLLSPSFGKGSKVIKERRRGEGKITKMRLYEVGVNS